MSDQRPAEIRASDQERERTCERLREATVEGRLMLDEFSERFMLAQQARSRDELDAIVRDLPAMTRPTREVPASNLTAIFGSIDRSGAWRLAPRTSVTTVFGSCKLDLRHATISSDVTEINVNVYFGSLELIIPEGIEIDVEAAVVLGSREIKLAHPASPSDYRPLIRVTGAVALGSVKVRDTPSLGDRIRESITAMFEQPRTNNQR